MLLQIIESYEDENAVQLAKGTTANNKKSINSGPPMWKAAKKKKILLRCKASVMVKTTKEDKFLVELISNANHKNQSREARGIVKSLIDIYITVGSATRMHVTLP